jgi:UDP-N-acetylglucosamine:LPS N-acetylglucosamine transferase
MKTAHFLITDAGSGHRSIANAVKDCLEQQDSDWQISIINVYQTFWHDDSEGIYNKILAWGLTRYYWPWIVPLGRCKFSLYRKRWTGLAQQWLAAHPADLVVSFIPFVNPMLQAAARNALPGARFVTLLCDLVDLDGYYLLPQAQFDAHIHAICPSPRAVQQALDLGYSQQQISATSGLPIHPENYAAQAVQRDLECAQLQLDPALPVLLLCFGSRGTPEYEKIIQQLEALPLQIIAVAGRNSALEQRLKTKAASQFRNRVLVLGFTDRLPYFMRLADVFIGKPGSTVYLAAMNRVPVICELNRHTMLQERANAQFLQESGMGATVDSFADILPAVQAMLEPATLASYRARLATYDNQAVFEAANALRQLVHNPAQAG